MPYKICIIGAGWYGCHLASSLAALGFDIEVLERHHRPLHEASGNNQFRLHMGFHYARHHGTRQQSRDGFMRFLERYPMLSAPVTHNVYAVPQSDSLIDYATYKMIMASSGIEFVELGSTHPLLSHIDGAMQVPERVLLINQARQFFSARLGDSLILGKQVKNVTQSEDYVEVDGNRFDYVIDATWGHFSPVPLTTYFEPTLLLYYETLGEFPAITFVDGPLCSVYPTEERFLYTLSSVLHTPLGSSTSSAEAKSTLGSVNTALIEKKRELMEAQISRNVPGFRDIFRFVGIQLAIKTKPVGKSDDRSCYVFQRNRVFSVMSGKIDTIFFATERILSLIEAQNAVVSDTTGPALRNDIIQRGSYQ